MAGVEYLPHQAEAIQKLRSGSILCGGVGTGKSITALGYFHDVECKSVEWTDGVSRGPMADPKPLYIITTARKRDTKEWEAECERFDFDIPITIDSWNNLHKYADVRGAFFIFDEQRVVGSGAWTKFFLKLTKANHWILLSATPGDTWMDYIPVFIANGFYKNRSQFLRRHAVYNRFAKYPKVDRWVEVGYLESLRRKITVTMTFERKTKPHYIDIPVEFNKDLYNVVLKDRWDPYKEEPIRDITGVCYLLRKVVNSDPSRSKTVATLIRDTHPKVIIFYNHNHELDQLRFELGRRGIPFAEWNGQKHEPIPSTDTWAYLVQYAAGCEGWNCTETDTIIFYSQSYSYKQMTQAAGRIDRLNTPFVDLYYYMLKSKSSIDNSIGLALRGKKSFNEKLFARQQHIDLPYKAE